MPPTTKKGEKKKGLSATNEVVTREYTISIHKHIMEWVPRSVPFRHLKRSGNLPQRRWELQMYALTPGSTQLAGTKELGMCRAIARCGCPENVMQMEIHQTGSICWSPTYVSPLSKFYRQLM